MALERTAFRVGGLAGGRRVNESAAHVLVVGDSHLSERNPEAGRNWSAVVAHVEAVAPDLVIHVGDISADGAHHPEDLDHARDQLARIEAPVHVLPGNHDLGDNPFGAPPADVIDAARLAHYRRVFDADRWCVEVGAWRLVGIDTQLFDSGLARRRRAVGMVGGAARRSSSTELHLALFVHKPVTVLDRSHDDIRSPGRYVPPHARRRLSCLIRAHRVSLVVSGHLHQARSAILGGATQVWAPSTWAVLPESFQPTLGDKRCGLLSLLLADDGSFIPPSPSPRASASTRSMPACSTRRPGCASSDAAGSARSAPDARRSPRSQARAPSPTGSRVPGRATASRAGSGPGRPPTAPPPLGQVGVGRTPSPSCSRSAARAGRARRTPRRCPHRSRRQTVGAVHLDGEQPGALAEELAGVDDARRLLVDRDEARLRRC